MAGRSAGDPLPFARDQSRDGRALVSAHAERLAAGAVVDEDRLQLGEEVQALLGHLALAHAGRLAAAERQLRLAAHCPLLDLHHPGLSLPPAPQRSLPSSPYT